MKEIEGKKSPQTIVLNIVCREGERCMSLVFNDSVLFNRCFAGGSDKIVDNSENMNNAAVIINCTIDDTENIGNGIVGDVDIAVQNAVKLAAAIGIKLNISGDNTIQSKDSTV